jgi:hypothetical protein
LINRSKIRISNYDNSAIKISFFQGENMTQAESKQDYDENGYKAPTTVIPNMMLCPKCNRYSFITEEIVDCRFCGSNEDKHGDFITQVQEKNRQKEYLHKIPRTVEGKECGVCGRDHRKEC